MSKSDKKLLVSGCGITFSGQTSKTWVNILSVAGADIIDVGAPAVSNQWIINRAFLQLEADPEIKKAIIQLTAIGKLDVEIDDERVKVLVEPDSIRDFTVDNVWPSSVSTEHESKRLWKQWLSSPGLEQQDIICKLKLLKHWCATHDVELLILQGYDLAWTVQQQQQLSGTINNINHVIIDEYKNTDWYDPNATIDVPVLGYQFELAQYVADQLMPDLIDRIKKMQQQHARTV